MIKVLELHDTLPRRAIWLLSLPCLWCGCRTPALTKHEIWEIRQRALAELKLSAATADDPQVRIRALRGLAADAEAHADLWTRLALFDPDPTVRLDAILLLRDRKAHLSDDLWTRLLGDEDPLVRTAAMLCLAEAGSSDSHALLAELRNTNMELRRRPEAIPLLRALNERSGDEELRHWLATAVESESALREAAQESLLVRGDPDVTREVTLQAQTGADYQQESAIAKLCLSTDADMIYILSERLENCGSLGGRLEAARGLGRFGSDAGLQLAMECLKFEPLSGDEAGLAHAAHIRASACEVCAEASTLEILAAVSERVTSDDDPGVRAACAGAALRILVRRTEAP